MQVKVRATYEEIWFDEGQEDPNEERGWVHPNNPWGSLKQDTNDDSCEPDTVVLDSLWEAAEFVLDFPGGVWDYHEAEAEQDVRSGHWESRMLHVQDHAETVFNLADVIEHLRAVGAEL